MPYRLIDLPLGKSYSEILNRAKYKKLFSIIQKFISFFCSQISYALTVPCWGE